MFLAGTDHAETQRPQRRAESGLSKPRPRHAGPRSHVPRADRINTPLHRFVLPKAFQEFAPLALPGGSERRAPPTPRYAPLRGRVFSSACNVSLLLALPRRESFPMKTQSSSPRTLLLAHPWRARFRGSVPRCLCRPRLAATAVPNLFHTISLIRGGLFRRSSVPRSSVGMRPDAGAPKALSPSCANKAERSGGFRDDRFGSDCSAGASRKGLLFPTYVAFHRSQRENRKTHGRRTHKLSACAKNFSLACDGARFRRRAAGRRRRNAAFGRAWALNVRFLPAASRPRESPG